MSNEEVGGALLYCHQELKQALGKTIEDLMPRLVEKYELSEHRIQHTMALACVGATCELLQGAGMSAEATGELHGHLVYVIQCSVLANGQLPN